VRPRTAMMESQGSIGQEESRRAAMRPP
jgi:hypothetical protein